MRITAKKLRRAYAKTVARTFGCLEDNGTIDRFAEIFGTNSVTINNHFINRYKDFDFEWLAQNLLDKEQHREFEADVAAAHQEHWIMTSLAEEIYQSVRQNNTREYVRLLSDEKWKLATAKAFVLAANRNHDMRMIEFRKKLKSLKKEFSKQVESRYA